MLLRQQFYKPVLHVVGILVFVYHNIAEASLIVASRLLVAFQQRHGLCDQVVEIHGVVAVQRRLVVSVDGAHHLCADVCRVFFHIDFRRQALFLAVTDNRQQVRHRIPLLIYIMLL